MSLISVITTVHNAEATIHSTLKSIQLQTNTEYEHIVIDDGSDDNSVSLIREFNDDHIVLIEPGRVGRAAALNIGLEKANGKYVAILDADDIALPDRLLKQNDILDKYEETVLVCSNAELIDKCGVQIGEVAYPLSHDGLVQNILRLNPFPHSSVMYRINSARNVGGYNQRCEKSIDFNFYLDLLLKGSVFTGLSESLIQLRSYPTSWGKNDNSGLQIRYGIIGLINYFHVMQGGKSFIRGNELEWLQIKSFFDSWFKKRGFQRKMEAKNQFSCASLALKHIKPFELVNYCMQTLKLDPTFFLYKGSGFRYPQDAELFLQVALARETNR